MNKSELIEITAADSGLGREQAAKAIDSMVSAVTDTLSRGEEVTLPGFGKFSLVHRPARTGRHPAPARSWRSTPPPHPSSPPPPA